VYIFRGVSQDELVLYLYQVTPPQPLTAKVSGSQNCTEYKRMSYCTKASAEFLIRIQE